LTKRDLKTFQNLSEIDFTTDDYWRPIAKNFPSFDSLIPSVGLFQITVALNHNVKMVALKEYNKIIGNTYNKPKLYFVAYLTNSVNKNIAQKMEKLLRISLCGFKIMKINIVKYYAFIKRKHE